MKCENKYAPQNLSDVLIPQTHIRNRIDAYEKGFRSSKVRTKKSRFLTSLERSHAGLRGVFAKSLVVARC